MQWRHNLFTWRHCHIFVVVLFLLSSLVTGTSFMSISSLVLEFWQFCFIRNWPEIWKSEISPYKFCPISGDWVKSGLPNLARRFPLKCYWMLQYARVTALIVYNPLPPPHTHTQISVNPLPGITLSFVFCSICI